MEAGRACRQNEQLVRTSVQIFIAFAAALIAATEMDELGKPLARVALESLGFVAGLVTINTILRSQSYYRAYVERAKEIETSLGFRLYTVGWESFESSTVSSWTISNKIALGILAVIPTLYLFGAFFVDLWKWNVGACVIVFGLVVTTLQASLIVAVGRSNR